MKTLKLIPLMEEKNGHETLLEETGQPEEFIYSLPKAREILNEMFEKFDAVEARLLEDFETQAKEIYYRDENIDKVIEDIYELAGDTIFKDELNEVEDDMINSIVKGHNNFVKSLKSLN